MERIIKTLVIVGILSVNFYITSFADDSYTNINTLITAQNVNYETCTKVFNTDHLNLFYLTIAAINANKFTINEMQTKSGYILFTAANRQFLASISNVNTKQAMLKITPADSNYYFQPGIILNIYKFIELSIQNIHPNNF